MEKFKNISEHINKNSSCSFCTFATSLKTDFCNFNVPITEYVPDKVVKFLNCHTEFKVFKVICNIFTYAVEDTENPFIFKSQI